MTSVAVWWSALVAGTLLLASSGVRTRMRAAEGRRIPRHGFFVPRPTHSPWWTMADLMVAIFLVNLAAGQLSETSGGHFAYLGCAVAAAALLQAAAVWRHNGRLHTESRHGESSEAARGVLH